MAGYTVVNFKTDVEDMAPKFGYSPGLESRFARKNLELEKSGVSYFKVAPDFETPFGHVHSEQEEVYVVISGNARAKIDDEVIELRQWDAIRGRTRRLAQPGRRPRRRGDRGLRRAEHGQLRHRDDAGLLELAPGGL